jgi:hypothetical protein
MFKIEFENDDNLWSKPIKIGDLNISFFKAESLKKGRKVKGLGVASFSKNTKRLTFSKSAQDFLKLNEGEKYCLIGQDIESKNDDFFIIPCIEQDEGFLIRKIYLKMPSLLCHKLKITENIKFKITKEVYLGKEILRLSPINL